VFEQEVSRITSDFESFGEVRDSVVVTERIELGSSE
jgi:hypothetical protein